MEKSPRKGFIYFSDDCDVLGLRYDNWKVVFMEQRVAGNLAASGRSPSSPLRVPKLFNLRTDPYERADITSNTYYDWFIDRDYHGVLRRIHRHPVPGDVQGVPTPPEGRRPSPSIRP